MALAVLTVRLLAADPRRDLTAKWNCAAQEDACCDVRNARLQAVSAAQTVADFTV